MSDATSGLSWPGRWRQLRAPWLVAGLWRSGRVPEPKRLLNIHTRSMIIIMRIRAPRRACLRTLHRDDAGDHGAVQWQCFERLPERRREAKRRYLLALRASRYHLLALRSGVYMPLYTAVYADIWHLKTERKSCVVTGYDVRCDHRWQGVEHNTAFLF